MKPYFTRLATRLFVERGTDGQLFFRPVGRSAYRLSDSDLEPASQWATSTLALWLIVLALCFLSAVLAPHLLKPSVGFVATLIMTAVPLWRGNRLIRRLGLTRLGRVGRVAEQHHTIKQELGSAIRIGLIGKRQKVLKWTSLALNAASLFYLSLVCIYGAVLALFAIMVILFEANTSHAAVWHVEVGLLIAALPIVTVVPTFVVIRRVVASSLALLNRAQGGRSVLVASFPITALFTLAIFNSAKISHGALPGFVIRATAPLNGLLQHLLLSIH